MHPFLLAIAFLLLPTREMIAQDTIAPGVYQRAIGFLPERTQDRLVNTFVRPNWFPDSTGLWFIDRSGEEKRYLSVSLPPGQPQPLFDRERLAESLEEALGEDFDPTDLPLENLRYRGDSRLSFTVGSESFLFDAESNELGRDEAPESAPNAVSFSPDSSWVAYAENHNLYLRKPDSTERRPLTTDGTKAYAYASWYGWDDIIEGENGPRPEHFGVEWSPDGEWLLANRVDLRSANKMYLLDWSVDSLFRPRLLSYYRGSPGDTGMVYLEPEFFNVRTGERVTTGLPRGTHINAVDVRWSETPGKVYLQWQPRGFKSVGLYTLDLSTGRLDTLYAESSPTNIDNFSVELAESSDRLFFLSEKSGWRQLYGLELTTGRENRLTRGDFYVNEIVRVDEAAATVYFLASGREPGHNPYHQQLYRVDFDGSDLQLLTPENANHRISFSPDGNYLVDNYSTVSTPTRTVVRDAAGGEVLTQLAVAEASGLGDWTPPEAFTALAADGQTEIYGAIWKPTDFDSTRRYPVIDASYTGPHTYVFPTDYGAGLSLQSFAELGFLVVRIDGRGSPGRSKAFHDYSYKNLGGNLGDHVAAIRQLGERHTWVDTSRVGIFGHSAGGYDAGHAVLAYPDFYKVAVASSADHDHRMEKAWWPEMYMGWPVDSAYHLQSNITMAGNLRGKLLITHGGIDENVNPSATFKLAEALIRADKRFDMLILPSQRHGYTGKAGRYFTKLRWNYFVEHLLGREPRWDITWPED
ncbi:dipeptidyl-peptidase-4 [Neolewinella xylanilytica]|uniref:Dipeptidyl-peptidase-4 n=1 Tax=Neolewinella xylanilytica TaxID=1514080 RepID=A0A2S6I8I5_9BACT|nr:DPP IV N-terminal domain-containing protein [Neolewinella xylanilytica]PPK87816.1 dipeptidyl-peptidase-4 [Neolewinella xylanilytica]